MSLRRVWRLNLIEFRFNMGTKVCSGCKIEKDITAFGKDGHSKDGFTYQCRECRKEINARCKKKYRDKYNAKQRERKNMPEFKEKKRVNDKLYRERHPEKVSAAKKSAYQKNKKYYFKLSAEWRKNNPEKYKAIIAKQNKRKVDNITNAYILDNARKIGLSKENLTDEVKGVLKSKLLMKRIINCVEKKSNKSICNKCHEVVTKSELVHHPKFKLHICKKCRSIERAARYFIQKNKKICKNMKII